MPTYFAYYQTGDYGKLWFEAESLEKAEKFLEKVQDCELGLEELPGVQIKVQGDEHGFQGLVEVD
jgi:hypothetical protein